MIKNVAIIGAGISGLSFAYYLKKYHPSTKFTIYEKSEKAGGVVYSEQKEGCVFEWGPRGIRPKGDGQLVLELIEELGLWDELVFSNEKSKKRYLFHDGKLNVLPHSLISFFKSNYLFLFLKATIRDLFSRKERSDESIATFITRHFGKKFNDLFFDCLVSGVWAGDVNKLSVLATFPMLKKFESKYGSVLLGMVKKKSNHGKLGKVYPKEITSKALFSLKGGVQYLIDGLKDELADHIVYNANIECIDVRNANLTLSGCSYSFSKIVSTIPSYELSKYLNGSLSELLSSINYAPIVVRNFITKSSEFSFDGFGFLVPSKEKSVVLGMVSNSNTFTSHAQSSLSLNTLMMGGARYSIRKLRNMDLVKESDVFLKKVFGKNIDVQFSELKIVEKAIPQYEVGHVEKVLLIEQTCPAELIILGNFMYGVSIIDIVKKSKEVAKNFG